MIDFERRSAETLLEDTRFDFLCPRFDDDGNLYLIRRPYEASGYQTPGYWGALVDFVKFPYRVCLAFIGFLNAMSMVFNQKPLSTAGGPKRKFDKPTHLQVRGRMLEIAAQNNDPKSPGALSIKVHANWELIKQDPWGEQTTLASSVAFYDLSREGVIAYSNGAKLELIDQNQQPKTVAAKRLIEEIAVL